MMKQGFIWTTRRQGKPTEDMQEFRGVSNLVSMVKALASVNGVAKIEIKFSKEDNP